jgi:DNA-binding CsgD family transcriptional regulator
MASSTAAKQRAAHAPRAGSSPSLETFLRDVARLASAEGNPARAGELDGETVDLIFELELDGARWLVARARPKVLSAAINLSPREREIARMVAQGYPNKTIAAVLAISTWTVCTYLRRIFAKVGVCSRAAMVARLIEQKLLQ